MVSLDHYSNEAELPAAEAGRIAMLLGLVSPQSMHYVELDNHVSKGLGG